MLDNCGRYSKVSLMFYAKYAHRYRQRHLCILCTHFVHLSVHLLQMLQYNREIVEALLNIEAIEASCQSPGRHTDILVIPMNSPSTCHEVFNGLTDHRRLQYYLRFCLFPSRYIINTSAIAAMFVVVINFWLFLFFFGVTFDSEPWPLANVLLNVHTNAKDTW